MKESRIARKRILVLGGIILLLVALAGAWRFRGRLAEVYDMGRTLLARNRITNDGDFKNILFVHHSTGANLIDQGNVRPLFDELGYRLWDHDYNYIGLTRPDGTATGYSYAIPDDNTDPDGYANLFSQPLRPSPTNAFSAIMQHEVIVFKSCFPTSDISDVAMLDDYKLYYLTIRDVMDRHPEHLFIAMTPPPLTPLVTTPENAGRARAFADWLSSDEFLGGRTNLRTFDFFDLLAEGDRSSSEYSMLRAKYRPEAADDSHPNALANETIGPLFVQFVVDAAEQFASTQR